MAQRTPDITHHTHTQQAAYNALHPRILPPLEPSIQLSFSSHTTTSDTSSEFTTYNHVKMMTTSKDSFAMFKQDSNKCPILHHGKLTAEIFRDFMTGCCNYVTNKEITGDKQMIKVMTMLKGYIWEDWVSIHYDELKTLSLSDFLQCFKDTLMPTEWEMDVRVKLNVMNQSENQTFCDYSTSVWNINSLLCGTDSFLDSAKLHTRIEAGMDLTLARFTRARDKKFHLITKFHPWLNALKELDTDIQAKRAECHAELEAMMKSIYHKSHDDCTLSDPSCKYNIPSAPSKPITLQMHLPALVQKTTPQNSPLKRVLFSSITMVARNAINYMFSTLNSMTFQRAPATSLSPKPQSTLHAISMRPKQKKQLAL